MRFRTRLLITAATVALAVGLANLDAGGNLISVEDVPKAINKLKTGTAAEKAAAAKALGNRGAIRASDVKEAIEPLKNLLANDSDAKARAAAAEALGKIAPEPKQTVPVLAKSLKEDKDEDVKFAVLIALGRMGPEARVALPEIRKYAQDKDNKKLSRTARDVMKNLNPKK